MSNFSFKKIDVPSPVTPYVYISVDGVDSAGEAVGNYGNVDGNGDGTFHGLIADTGNGTTYDPLGSTNTDIAGITPTGEIFGDYVDNANRQHGFVDNNGVVTNVDVFLANSTTVSGVNDAGVIYGAYADAANGVHGFIDNAGVFTQIDVPGAASSSVSGVNAAGTIVGTFTDAEFAAHGYVYSNGTYRTFDPPGSIFTSVVGVSDSGMIVGNFQDSSNNTYGFIDNNGVITTINIPGATSTGVSAVDAAGEIVGYYADGGGNVHGFVDNGGIIATVDVPGATQTDILGVNASGEISGYYNDSSGQQHGFVATPATTVIEAFGSTSLVEVGSNYFLDSIATGTGPELKFGGAPVVVGQAAPWTPIGAEATATGYDVAWHEVGTDQYSIWSTDSSGHFVSFLTGAVSGSSALLESYESIFSQDLNGDGVTGLPAGTTLIQTDASTSLIQTGSNYYLQSTSTGTGPELKFGGGGVVAGQAGAWTPIGAVQTSAGYDVAWHEAGTSQYSIWSTDSSGNFVSFLTGAVSGSSALLESYESIFSQDLNGDGVTGLPAGTTLIQTDASTSLIQTGSNYYLQSTSTGTGPELKFGGGGVVAGQAGAWTPIGAVQTSAGYDVAWHEAGTDQYSIWSTDSSGNFLSFLTGAVSGTSATLESYEPTFGQDLNGDGIIGIPASSTFALQYKGFDYVAFYNGAYENSDSLPSLVQTGANSIEATLDYGINVTTSQVVADPNYTDSLAALGSTIAQAESLGLSVMVRPLIDFLNPSEIGPYSVGEWRQDYQPTNVAAFFASYKQMIVQEAQVAQANGAQMLSIGAELDQLAGSQYLSYWTDIISAVRQVFTGALTYSASWNTASQVSFWSQLNYEGIDNYVPLSNAPNPTLQDLVNGWLQPATPATNPGAYAAIGNLSPIQYFENLSAASGKPLLFTELGYANDSGAAADPSASGNSPDPTLQAELYQAFFQAWTQSKSTSLIGAYFWEWDPNGSTSNVGPNIDSFSPQNSPALAQATAGFEAVSVPTGGHLVLTQAIGPAGSATIGASATLELAAADSGSVTFSAPTGMLIIDHSASFSAQVLNLTGNGNLSGSDQIDLKDIAFGAGTTVGYVGTASGGTLTVSDAQNHTAKISLAGDYTHSTFSLSSDGHGGTVVIDPPGKQDAADGTLSFSDPNPMDHHAVGVSPQNGGAGYVGNFTVDAANTAGGQDSVGWHFNFDSAAVTNTVTQSYDVSVAGNDANGANSTITQSVSVTIAGPGHDSFVFHPGVGADVVVNAASTDSIELDGFSAVTNSHQLAVLLNDAQTGQPQSLFQSVNGGNDTVINLGNHDSITLQNVHLADLHAGSFIIH